MLFNTLINLKKGLGQVTWGVKGTGDFLTIFLT
jgi:hypothetical protein